MKRSATSLTPLARVLVVGGLACLAIITFASSGATRMYAWPWSCLYVAALVSPACVLVLRIFDAQRPLALPPRPWRWLALTAAAVVIASALASPYRAPSLLWSAPLLGGIAVFLVACDWLQADPTHAAKLATAIGCFFAAVALASLAWWAGSLPGRTATQIADARNPHPLGHSSYTAGLALLALPWFVALAWRARGVARGAWVVAVVLGLGMLLTSASRGALLGLAALAAAALLIAPVRRKGLLAFALLAAGLALLLAHPRTRAMFTKTNPAAPPNISNVQRTAMLTAAWRMGRDHPLLGWGPGTTPLAFPRYRADLDGGAENYLQLHCTPAQLWAEFGAAGILTALVFLVLATRSLCQVLRDKAPPPSESSGECHLLSDKSAPALAAASEQCHLLSDIVPRTAAAALAGYAAFALTDWQLDVPVFAFALATLAALLAVPRECHLTDDTSRRGDRRVVGTTVLVTLALVGLLGRRDAVPEMNVRALALARDPANADRAVALLRESLALNPHQEIAHFNLGWLLVVRDPAEAERHFLAAAHLVPDKGGVYLGLGLACLNQGHRQGAIRAFALECLNDPVFLASPWWREPAIAAQCEAARAEFSRLAASAEKRVPAGSWAVVQLARVAALAPKLGAVPPGAERQSFRARSGYPVLMRNLDLPAPVDLFPVRESAAPPAGGLPAKGWLPSPLLIELLDAPAAK